jgi:hypothetical protein
MGFHKRYIDDEQIMDIYSSRGIAGVVEWYIKGVDAIITQGKLSMDISDVLYTDELTKEEQDEEIERLIVSEKLKKGYNEKEEKAATSS